MGVRPSLDTDGAREVDALDAGIADLGVGALDIAGVEKTDVFNGGLGVATLGTLRLRLIMLVSSFLKVSRSLYATLWGDMNVKLWPLSSPTNPNFNLICAAPSLLQNNAVKRVIESALKLARTFGDLQLTSCFRVRNPHGRSLFSISEPLQMRFGELQLARSFLIRRLGRTHCGRHAMKLMWRSAPVHRAIVVQIQVTSPPLWHYHLNSFNLLLLQRLAIRYRSMPISCFWI